MELNLFTILYLFFRLAPFIIVCFFTLQSVFNQDLRGIIYLVGLIFACVFTTMIGSIPGFQYIVEDYGEKMPANVKQVCRLIELSNGAPVSYIPLGQTVLAYTFIYLVYIIVNHNLVMQNIPTLVIFPTLIVADMAWNVANSCSSIALLFLSLILGGGIGALWAYIIDSTGKADLQLFNGISSQSVCTRPSKQILRCRPTGDLSQLIGSGVTINAPPPPLVNANELTSTISQYLYPSTISSTDYDTALDTIIKNKAPSNINMNTVKLTNGTKSYTPNADYTLEYYGTDTTTKTPVTFKYYIHNDQSGNPTYKGLDIPLISATDYDTKLNTIIKDNAPSTVNMDTAKLANGVKTYTPNADYTLEYSGINNTTNQKVKFTYYIHNDQSGNPTFKSLDPPS